MWLKYISFLTVASNLSVVGYTSSLSRLNFLSDRQISHRLHAYASNSQYGFNATQYNVHIS